MSSIINGLFAGRAGIASHGIAIAVVGDNISNASTIGYKASRAEFEDFIAGGQTAGKVVGSGSNTAGVTTIFSQGTFESTGRPLDMAIDGNGFFVVENNGQRLYTRAGNFKLDTEGYLIDQNNFRVQGFPGGGTGSLQAINVNTIEQSEVATTEVGIQGNLDARDAVTTIPAARSPTVAVGTTSYSDLNDAASFSTVVDTFDSLGAKHTLTLYAYKTATNTFAVRAYGNGAELSTTGTGQANASATQPFEIGNGAAASSLTMSFNSSGQLTTTNPTLTLTPTWNNGSAQGNITIDFSGFTQYSTSANVSSITQDGQGVGSVTSVSIDSDGSIFALLDNGQRSVVGQIGMANFANVEALTRVGGNLLQQSTASGEPVVGRPATGTYGEIKSGQIELSTTDTAGEFVKLITLQRGFQANSRIITTINQLLQEIIQLA